MEFLNDALYAEVISDIYDIKKRTNTMVCIKVKLKKITLFLQIRMTMGKPNRFNLQHRKEVNGIIALGPGTFQEKGKSSNYILDFVTLITVFIIFMVTIKCMQRVQKCPKKQSEENEFF